MSNNKVYNPYIWKKPDGAIVPALREKALPKPNIEDYESAGFWRMAMDTWLKHIANLHIIEVSEELLQQKGYLWETEKRYVLQPEGYVGTEELVLNVDFKVEKQPTDFQQRSPGVYIGDIKEVAVPIAESQPTEEWDTHKVIDFVNWFLKLHNLPSRYQLENMEIIWSFLRGDDYKIWQSDKTAQQQSQLISDIMVKHIPCTCNEAYKSRDMDDPDCPLHSYGDSIAEAMKELLTLWQQQKP